MKKTAMLTLAALFSMGLLLNPAQAGDTPGVDQDKIKEMKQNAVDFLKTTQAEDGSWTSPQALGVTALVTNGLLAAGISPDDETVAAGLKQILNQVKEDGGIYVEKSTHRNYETAIALMALAKANQDGRFKEQVANAEKFLRNLQWDEGEGLESSDTAFGGAGYGSRSRPDLSNTQFLLEALKAAGAKEDDPAFQKALIFVSRTQNLETEHNTTPFAAKVNDGGFYYTPAAGGTSQAGTTPEGGLRSYGSMTYAGLKSMIYAGLTMDDPRVKAAHEWLQKHYTLDENPGMGQQGLYYYYQTYAKTLNAMGKDEFVDAQGNKHNWRQELVDKLASKQRENGSWVNEAERWYEGDPNLVTAYVLMALEQVE